MNTRFVWCGWIAGLTEGFGLAGFWFLNPYIALSLFLGGVALKLTTLTATRETVREQDGTG